MHPLIIQHGTRLKKVVSFMLRTPYPKGRAPCYQLRKELGKTKAGIKDVTRSIISSRNPVVESEATHCGDCIMPASTLCEFCVGCMNT